MKEYISSHYGRCKKDSCECLKQNANFDLCQNWQKFNYENFDQMILDLPNIRKTMETKNEDKN